MRELLLVDGLSIGVELRAYIVVSLEDRVDFSWLQPVLPIIDILTAVATYPLRGLLDRIVGAAHLLQPPPLRRAEGQTEIFEEPGELVDVIERQFLMRAIDPIGIGLAIAQRRPVDAVPQQDRMIDHLRLVSGGGFDLIAPRGERAVQQVGLLGKIGEIEPPVLELEA